MPNAAPPRAFRATANDFAVARAAMADVHQRVSVDEHALTAFLASPDCYLFVSTIAGEVVGSLNGYSLLRPGGRQLTFLLYELDVKERWRRRGVGAALVNAFVSEAPASGGSELWVLTNDSNVAATSAYRRCGFSRRNQDDVMLSLAL